MGADGATGESLGPGVLTSPVGQLKLQVTPDKGDLFSRARYLKGKFQKIEDCRRTQTLGLPLKCANSGNLQGPGSTKEELGAENFRQRNLSVLRPQNSSASCRSCR